MLILECNFKGMLKGRINIRENSMMTLKLSFSHTYLPSRHFQCKKTDKNSVSWLDG